MNPVYKRLHKAGLEVRYLWPEPERGQDVSDLPQWGHLARVAILEEVRKRKCSRRSCLRHGCDCEEP